MKPRKPTFLPRQQRMLQQVGDQLKLARLRRGLSTAMVSERAGISRNTLYVLEKGEGNTSMATLFKILIVLGLEDDFAALARDDELGRKLADAKLSSTRKRAPKRTQTDHSDDT